MDECFEFKEPFTPIYKISTNYILPDTITLINDTIFLFPEMYSAMCDLKSEIDNNENSKLWDKAKKKVNPYENVNMLGTNILVGEKIRTENYTPLSRAFFKLTEIWSLIDLIPEKYKKSPGVISNIAEGPGGFIEAIYKQRTLVDIHDTFYATTLQTKNKNIPGWNQIIRRKNHFLNNKNVILKTGNLYNKNTILSYAALFKQKAFLVTCDGGFDYSDDFNNQELNSRKIIYAELITTLLIQEEGGTMVCKMFDTFTHFSNQIIYLLSIFYEKINIIKPLTSRPANSEKYIIARGFKNPECKKLILSMLYELEKWDDLNTGVISNLPLPDRFIEEMKNINISLTTIQKEYIIKTLEYIQYYDTSKNNLEYSNLWFEKYKIVKKENL